MGIAELIGFAVGALRGHRLRTALSVAGVAVGIAAVVALTALGEGARNYVTQEFMSLGTNMLEIMPGKTETTGMIPMFGGSDQDLTIEDALAVATRVPQVASAAPLAMMIGMSAGLPAVLLAAAGLYALTAAISFLWRV